MRAIRIWVVLLAGFMLASQSALAQTSADVLLAMPTRISDQGAYFDPGYVRLYDCQHLGVDVPASEGSDVYAPIDGNIVVNRTYDANVMRAYLVIRSPAGSEHVLGHISSSLTVGTPVVAGDRVGAVRAWPDEPQRNHVHWGVNRIGVAQAMRGTDCTLGDWGWGRAPASATRADAARRGWLDPTDASALQAPPPANSSNDVGTHGARTFDVFHLAEDGVSVAIVRVVAEPTHTAVHLQAQSAVQGVCWYFSGPNTPYLLADGRRYGFVGGDGVSSCPNRQGYGSGETMVLRFDPLEHGVREFSLIEGENRGGARFWNFVGVRIRP